MVNYFKLSIVSIFIFLLFSQVVLAEDMFCYRDVDRGLVCFKSMEEIPELHRPNAFYKPTNTPPTPPSIPSLPKPVLDNPSSLPPAKTSEDLELNTKSLPTEIQDDSKLEIFVAKWCPHCKALEKFLKERGISYKRYDVEADEYGAKIYEQEGTLPISILKGKTILGFDPRKYGEIIDAELPY